MLTIRLQRAGKKNKPEYRIVLAEKTAASQKKFVEILGAYNPHSKNLVIRSEERLNYWMKDQHVELSATVNNLLITKQLLVGTKVKSFTLPKKEVVAEEAPAAPATPAVEVPVEEAAPEPVVETSAPTAPEEPKAE